MRMSQLLLRRITDPHHEVVTLNREVGDNWEERQGVSDFNFLSFQFSNLF